MNVGVVAAKLDHRTKDFEKNIAQVIKDLGEKSDMSYFDTGVEEDTDNLSSLYQKNQSLIRKNDLFIADITFYSSGIGYLVSEAINNKKPVLVLFNKEYGTQPSNIIKSTANNKRVFFREYTFDNLSDIVKKYFRSSKRLIDTRYILNLPSHLDRFLDYYSYKRGIPKSHIVREAIERTMNENKG